MAKLKTVKEIHGTVSGGSEQPEIHSDFIEALSAASELADYVEVVGDPLGRRLADKVQESVLKLMRKHKVRLK
jgi:hypothetical protein